MVNGEVIPFNEARIHILSHVIHYGTGVFEGIKCYNTPMSQQFKLKEHMVRLHQSAKNYKMSIPFQLKNYAMVLLILIRSNSLNNCYLRPVAYYGYDTLGVHLRIVP